MRLYMKKKIASGNTIKIMIVSSDETSMTKNKEVAKDTINNLNYIGIKDQSIGNLAKIIYKEINRRLEIESFAGWIQVHDDECYVEYP